jgi:hypothetical protein
VQALDGFFIAEKRPGFSNSQGLRGFSLETGDKAVDKAVG